MVLDGGAIVSSCNDVMLSRRYVNMMQCVNMVRGRAVHGLFDRGASLLGVVLVIDARHLDGAPHVGSLMWLRQFSP